MMYKKGKNMTHIKHTSHHFYYQEFLHNSYANSYRALTSDSQALHAWYHFLRDIKANCHVG